MVYLTKIAKGEVGRSCYPYSVPSVASFSELELNSPVVFFVGENASGKSTMLESIAIASRRITIGGVNIEVDKSLDVLRPFADGLTLSWRKRTSKGFFLRAEDFFNFIRRNRELSDELQGYADEYADYEMAQRAMLGQKRAIESRYGELENQSHGEGFLQVFKSRIVSGGLYLLDEPEAALSPQSQLALMYQMKNMVDRGEGAQFIIATHSPILMSFPGAQIITFDHVLEEKDYEDVGHVDLFRRFLSNPQCYLDRLFSE